MTSRTNRTRIKRRFLAAALFILLLATALRFYRLDAQSFWNDEGNSARVSERSLALILEGTASDIHPPLYYLLLRGWRELLGDSEFGLRSLSAFAGVAVVALVVDLGRVAYPGRGRPTALLAGLLAALSPALIYYSQEARMYALLALWAALSTLLLLRLPGRAYSHRLALAYVLTSAAGLYTHYFYPAVLLWQNILVLIHIGHEARSPHPLTSSPPHPAARPLIQGHRLAQNRGRFAAQHVHQRLQPGQKLAVLRPGHRRRTVGAPVGGHPHHRQPQAVTGEERSRQVKSLGHQDSPLHAKDVLRPVARIVGAQPGRVQLNHPGRDTPRHGIITHPAGFVIIRVTIVTAEQQPRHLTRLVQLNGRVHPVLQHRAKPAIAIDRRAKDNGHPLGRHLVGGVDSRGIAPFQPAIPGKREESQPQQKQKGEQAAQVKAFPALAGGRRAPAGISIGQGDFLGRQWPGGGR